MPARPCRNLPMRGLSYEGHGVLQLWREQAESQMTVYQANIGDEKGGGRMRKRGPAVRRKLQYQGGWLQLHGKKFPKAWLGHWSIYDGYGSRHRRSAVI